MTHIVLCCDIMQLKRQPIHFACQGGHVTVVKELIDKHGVDPDTVDGVSCLSLRGLIYLISYILTGRCNTTGQRHCIQSH